MGESTNQPVGIDLSRIERHILLHGVRSWNGPAYRPAMVARALGLPSRNTLRELTARLDQALRNKQPMVPADWSATLFLTEVGFASTVAGQGSQWPTTTGLDETVTLHTLRTLQQRLSPLVRRAAARQRQAHVSSSIPKASIVHSSVSGDGMHVELCIGDETGSSLPEAPDPVIIFRSANEGEITWLVDWLGQAVEFPLEELERAIEIAKREVHSEGFYDQ